MDQFLKNSKLKSNHKDGIELSTTSKNIVDIFFSFDKELLRSIQSEYLYPLLWYYRDIRGNGKGRRDEFKLILKELTNRKINIDLQLIAEYGRFKDLMELLNDVEFTSIHPNLLNIIKLNWDNNLLKKYLPQLNKPLSSRIIRYVYNIEGKIPISLYTKYRKHKTSYKTIERHMTLREPINFEQVPSVCMKIHGRPRMAFNRDIYENKFNEYKSKLESGEVKVNTQSINPIDIYKEYRKGNMNEVLEAQLNQYPFEFDGDVLVVMDTSASMSRGPICVSKGLGVFLMKRNKGRFHNLGIVFAGDPVGIEIKDGWSYEVVWDNLPTINDQSTKIGKVFEYMYEVSDKGHELPKAIVLFSDMQFDEAYRGYTDTEYNKWKKILKDQFPQVIFWNCNETINKSFPVSHDEKGTILLGGNNPRIFFDVMNKINKGEDITPLGFVMDVLKQYPQLSI
jgi:hypothetical protein